MYTFMITVSLWPR